MTDDLEPLDPEAAMNLYLDQREPELSDRTHRSHGYRLEQFVMWCDQEGFTNMNDLTGRDLHSFRVWRREEGDLKPVSLQSHMSTLRVFLEFCESIDAVLEDLRSKVMLPSVPEEGLPSEARPAGPSGSGSNPYRSTGFPQTRERRERSEPRLRCSVDPCHSTVRVPRSRIV